VSPNKPHTIAPVGAAAEPRRYDVRLEAAPGEEHPDQRLKSALKFLWRAFKLRAVHLADVVDVHSPESPSPAADAPAILPESTTP